MILKKVTSTLENISPKLTAKLAYHFMSNPRFKKPRAFEKDIIQKATQSTIKYEQYDIAVYKWGDGNRKVLLVHGWEGRASNFGAIIPLFLDKGYQVISFDLPSHGNSTKKAANTFECTGLVKLFLEEASYDFIITHSMGSVLTIMAMDSFSKYSGNQMIMFTTPHRFEEFLDLALENYGLTEKTKHSLVELLRPKSKYEPLELCATDLVQKIDMKKAFIIHDKMDKVIPIENSIKVSSAFKNSEFIEIEGTGHFRMLWSTKVLDILKEKVLVN